MCEDSPQLHRHWSEVIFLSASNLEKNVALNSAQHRVPNETGSVGLAFSKYVVQQEKHSND